MGWRLYTVTDWCVEKMGPWTGRGAILFPDLARHNHTSPPPPHWQPAKRSPATRSAKSHGAHGAPYPRTCVSGCLYVGCAVRTMVDRPPGQRDSTSMFLGGFSGGKGRKNPAPWRNCRPPRNGVGAKNLSPLQEMNCAGPVALFPPAGSGPASLRARPSARGRAGCRSPCPG